METIAFLYMLVGLWAYVPEAPVCYETITSVENRKYKAIVDCDNIKNKGE